MSGDAAPVAATDVVERLREVEISVKPSWAKPLREAAAEIARLRAEVAELRKRKDRLETEVHCLLAANTLRDLERAKCLARATLGREP